MKKNSKKFVVWFIVTSLFLVMVVALLGHLKTPKIHPKFLDNFTVDIKKTSAGFENSVTSLAYDEKSRHLVIGRESGNIEIWDTTAENSKQIIPNAHENRVSQLLFTTDGQYFFSSSYFRDAVKFWDVRTNTLLYSIPEFLGPVIRTPAEDIYLVADTSAVYFFDAKNKSLILREFLASGVVDSFAIDEKTNLVAIGTSSGSIDLFEMLMIDGVPGLKKLGGIKPYRTGEWVIALHFSSDSKSLYSISRSGQIDEWKIPNFEKMRTLNTKAESIYEAKFLLDGKFLALVGAFNEEGAPGEDFVEVISPSSGASVMKKMTTNFANIEYIPPLNQLMAISGRTVIMIDMPK